MIKFFTILFLVYYIFRVFNPSFMVGTFNKLNEDFKAFNNAKDDKEKEEIVINRIAAILGRLVLLCITIIPLTIAEIIYIFSAVQYGSKIITIGFIIWYFLLFLLDIIINKTKEDKFEKVKRFSFKRLFINAINVVYFGYMYYILFLV